ncbi:MAG: tetratricopeptide repeat protein [Gammaproteobacteria bacterium]|nr:tetratricopeptide repeat protein [Gammaproteobacteria bacterium]
MPSSTVQREKLLSPLALAFIAGLFAVAFFVLLPSSQTLIENDTAKRSITTEDVDQLDIAYLRARLASGDYDSEEAAAAAVALFRENKIDEAYSVLRANPTLDISSTSRFILDLEMAAAESVMIDQEGADYVRKANLGGLLETLLEKHELQSVELLERGLVLSKMHGDSTNTQMFYEKLAKTSPEKAWYVHCGEYFSAIQQVDLAAHCYSEAIASSGSSEQKFQLSVSLLDQLKAIGDEHNLELLVKNLSAAQDLSAKELQSLAEAYLRVERPDAAVDAYRKLALVDQVNAGQWYQEAARWAEASGQPAEAARLLSLIDVGDTEIERFTHERKIQALLIASGDREKVLARSAKTIKENPGNVDVLRQGVVVAQQMGASDSVHEWNQAILALNPDDIEAIALQIDLAMAKPDLEAAYFWAEKAVALNPDSIEYRRRLAQLSEWTGDPVSAQAQWQVVAAEAEGVEALDQVTRLATMNLQPGSAAEAKLALLQRQQYTAKDIEDLVKLYELDGRPELAVAALLELENKHGVDPNIHRTLAKLHKRHADYEQSLNAWTQYAKLVGDTTESSLNRIELHWFLNQPDKAANLTEALIGRTLGSTATDVQALILSEIAWRYDKPKLAQLVKPLVRDVESNVQRNKQSTRIVRTLDASGRRDQAIQAAAEFWRDDRSVDMALQGLVLAIKSGNSELADPFLDHADNPELLKFPEYWSAVASVHLQKGDEASAKRAYEKALELSPKNANALSGMLWLHIASGDREKIQQFLDNHYVLAKTESELWAPYAVGYLQIGDAKQSISWFEHSLDTIDTDYSMLLTYADALELGGSAEKSLLVRRYALQRLRPILAESTAQEQGALVRQYGRLLARYGGATEQEQWTNYMLQNDFSDVAFERFWQQDMAISWLMSTQRHEHAQILMSQLHEQRLKSPAWQQVGMALHKKDAMALAALLQSGNQVSVGNQILALRQLGKDEQAYILAMDAMENGPTRTDRQIALEQYVSMRSFYPSFTSATVSNSLYRGLGIRQSGVKMRHTLLNNQLGFGVEIVNSQFSSDKFFLLNNAERSDVSLSLFFGNRLAHSRLTTGYTFSEDINYGYANVEHVRQSRSEETQLNVEFAYSEPVDSSPELRIAAVQHRATIGLDHMLGAREFIKIQASATEIATRVERNKVARGLQASAQLGLRGNVGSNVWSTGIVAGRRVFDRRAELPEELRLSQRTTLDTVLAREATTLALAASLSRGGINNSYPQTSSPRYYFNGSVGHSWPDKSFGLQVDAGAGIRVFGSDELSVELNHDRQQSSDNSFGVGFTSFGLNYQYHF